MYPVVSDVILDVISKGDINQTVGHIIIEVHLCEKVWQQCTSISPSQLFTAPTTKLLCQP